MVDSQTNAWFGTCNVKSRMERSAFEVFMKKHVVIPGWRYMVKEKGAVVKVAK